MTRSNQARAKRSGVTLIELLVVATIMLTLAAVSVPTIKPMMESQATSHAAQTVATYLERAKAHAVVTGRPSGVTFEFFPGTDSYDGSASLYARGAFVVARKRFSSPLRAKYSSRFSYTVRSTSGQ